MSERQVLSIFKNTKPVFGMLHLKGDNREDIFERFKKELQIYLDCGIDAVILENYFGDYDNLVDALEYISKLNLEIPYGVNCLNIDQMGFYLAQKYHAAFVQVDSVVGHVKPRDEATLREFFNMMRNYYDGYVFGGVRFKYQPMLSEKTVEEDLEIAKTRCDAVCVTQDRTGQETSMEKIIQFRNGLGYFPLIVAAGVTADNIEKQFEYADAVIVGSYFKDNYKDEGELCAEHVREILDIVENIRKKG